MAYFAPYVDGSGIHQMVVAAQGSLAERDEFRRLGPRDECGRRNAQVESQPQSVLKHILNRFALQEAVYSTRNLDGIGVFGQFFYDPTRQFPRLGGVVNSAERLYNMSGSFIHYGVTYPILSAISSPSASPSF